MESSSVCLEIAADTRDIAIARSVTAAMAARADLTLDQLEDARLAVDEAAAYLITQCRPDDRVRLELRAGNGSLSVHVSAPSNGHTEVQRETFGWMVLSALATNAGAVIDNDTTTITMDFLRPAPVQA